LAVEELKAALELLVTTGERMYAERFLHHREELEAGFPMLASLAVRAMPYLDDDYRAGIERLAAAHRKQLDDLVRQNPYGVPITEGGWAGNGAVIGAAMANYYLHRAFPATIGKEDVLRGLNYILGTHPGSNLSFVSAVGARSKQVAYGMNRADFSFIAAASYRGC
jgi:hypothetical protein